MLWLSLLEQPQRTCLVISFRQESTEDLNPSPFHHFITIIALSAALAVSEAKSAALVTSVAASALWCPDGWIGYREKCYYFSEAQRNWTSSKRHCSFLGASLIQIDNEQEKAFIMRYKGRQDAWIGLYRDPGQAWRWVNGTEIKTGFTVKGGGNCAYLNDEDAPSSSRCYTERHWICSKADVYIQRKENPSASRKCLVWEVQ
uniref:C-type lectin domain-containing protein n=1 Tax=Sphenodon punctatus TaxID=8508 RepID=A0A8D0H6F1_SPHPU